MDTVAKPRPRKRNPAATKERILRSAMTEFCAKGYGGASIAKIVKRAKCNIRMVYHYFGGKEGLYLACLERVYMGIRESEAKLELKNQEPLDAIRILVKFTFDYMQENPDFIKMAGVENIQRGRLIKKLPSLASAANSLIITIENILLDGENKGVIRPDIDALQLYISILSMSYLHLSNRYTLAITYGSDFADPEWRQRRKEHLCDMVHAYIVARDFQPGNP